MNKSKFKALRSEYRKCHSNAYFESTGGESFGKNLKLRISNISDPDFDLALFEGCEKPVVRNLIVSMPVFRALGYPFKKFETLL